MFRKIHEQAIDYWSLFWWKKLSTFQ